MIIKFLITFLLITLSLQKDTDSTGDAIAWTASYYEGYPVVEGESGPDAFDAPGLCVWAYYENKISLPPTIEEQFKTGKEIDFYDVDNGDLMFFDCDHKGTATHVGIYMGNGEMLHAFQDGGVVEYADVDSEYFSSRFVGARRPW